MAGIIVHDWHTFLDATDPPDPDDWEPCPTCDGCGILPADEDGTPLPFDTPNPDWYTDCPDCTTWAYTD